MAGLSVAFDASCEEMWLAWRYGACLVPAPRSLVRSGMDARAVAGRQRDHGRLHGADARRAVAARGARDGAAADPRRRGLPARARRRGWPPPAARSGTPTGRPRRPSSRAARGSTGDGPVRIGLPLDGWDLAVVDADGAPVPPGETGELIIGGVGLARYLDPAKDAEKYAPMPSLGWDAPTAAATSWSHDADGPALRRASRRPGQARRPTDRARRGRQRAAGAARASPAPRPPSGAPAPATSCSSATSRPRRVRPGERRWSALRAGAAGGARAAAGAGGRPADPDLRQGRPGRPAVAAARPADADAPTLDRHGGVGGRAVERDARRRRRPAATTTSSTSGAAA